MVSPYLDQDKKEEGRGGDLHSRQIFSEITNYSELMGTFAIFLHFALNSYRLIQSSGEGFELDAGMEPQSHIRVSRRVPKVGRVFKEEES